jgi:hypothetical protein
VQPDLCPALRTIVGAALSRDGVTVVRTGVSDENLGILAAKAALGVTWTSAGSPSPPRSLGSTAPAQNAFLCRSSDVRPPDQGSRRCPAHIARLRTSAQRWGLVHQDGGMRSTSLNVWSCSAMRADLTAQGQRTADDLTDRFG